MVARDVSGGFASPLAAELIGGADLIVGWGCALNMWTMRHGRLIGRRRRRRPGRPRRPTRSGATARSPSASSATCATAEAAAAPRPPADGRLPTTRCDGDRAPGPLARRALRRLHGAERIDPRTLTIALDDLLPAERVVVDSGNFMGYPSMYLVVPDEFGFCFTQAFQSIGLGLATAIGAALARPDRLPSPRSATAAR